jgi:surfeit locus 1 family protein
MKKFSFNWKLAVFSMFFFGFFIWLGFWQIDRGNQKSVWIEMDKQRRSQPGVELDQLLRNVSEPGKFDGQPVLLEGYFQDNALFLLDNRVLRGKVGYEILAPFRDKSGLLVLVNRGFVPMGRTRADKPEIPPASGRRQIISGQIYVSRSQGSLSNAITRLSVDSGRLHVVQSLDTSVIANVLNEELYPHVIRLSEEDRSALPRHWPLVTMLPERHFGYAFTWFLMAVAVFISFVTFTYYQGIEGHE